MVTSTNTILFLTVLAFRNKNKLKITWLYSCSLMPILQTDFIRTQQCGPLFKNTIWLDSITPLQSFWNNLSIKKKKKKQKKKTRKEKESQKSRCPQQTLPWLLCAVRSLLCGCQCLRVNTPAALIGNYC